MERDHVPSAAAMKQAALARATELGLDLTPDQIGDVVKGKKYNQSMGRSTMLTIQHLLPETISSAIGCDVVSEAAQKLFENLNIKWQDFKLLSKDIQVYGYDSKDVGITIMAQDEGFIRKNRFTTQARVHSL